MCFIEFFLQCFNRHKKKVIINFDKYKYYKKKHYAVQKFNPKLNVIYEENEKYYV
jgi:hypothetical protein